MRTDDYPRPISHTELRALLRVVERAYARKDIDALNDAFNLANLLPSEYYEDLQTYILGTREWIRYGDEDDYPMYDNADIHEAKETLEMSAYGDFDEAMDALTYDLRGIDRCRSKDSMQSLVFRPELFTDEDRQKWKELLDVALDCLHKPHDSKLERKVEDAVMAIRSYQQRSFGPLVPTLTATYRRDDEGVSVRLTWFDECLYVTTHATFYEALDEYFITTAPIDGLADFTPDCFPKLIGGHTLGGITSINLFRYEL